MVAKWEKALSLGIVFRFLSQIDASFQAKSGTDSLSRHTAESQKGIPQYVKFAVAATHGFSP